MLVLLAVMLPPAVGRLSVYYFRTVLVVLKTK